MIEKIDCVVIGAGVIGLACARALAMAGREVVILERADTIGAETSARNSEVIHAGIYYPKGSEKARLCVRGRDMLYNYCASHGIGHNRCGKLIVATNEDQLVKLGELSTKACENGVDDLRRLSAHEAMTLEPNLHCTGALLSPSTGLVDSHGLMLAYLGDAEAAGAMLAYYSPVESGRVTDEGIVLNVGGESPITLIANSVVNAVGLWAQPLAHCIEGIPSEVIPARYFARGVYFTVSGKPPFSRLIYPVPEPGGLGCHFTIDLGGQGKFGPDVEWIDDIDYTIDPARAQSFDTAIRRYWPGLPEGVLEPGYAGIRPKIHPSGSQETDFIIQGAEVHGVKGLVCLYGIESPGLTASMAIAEEVVRVLDHAAVKGLPNSVTR